MIEYVVGDIFDVKDDERVLIVHVVNNVGLFGAGFAAEIAERYPVVRTDYMSKFVWANLGDVILRDAQPNITVASLFAQEGVRSRENAQPIRYSKLDDALYELSEIILESGTDYEVRMPRIGCGLAGGLWSTVEQIVEIRLASRGIPVTVYDKA